MNICPMWFFKMHRPCSNTCRCLSVRFNLLTGLCACVRIKECVLEKSWVGEASCSKPIERTLTYQDSKHLTESNSCCVDTVCSG